MFKIARKRLKGIKYLLLHPKQVKWLVTREIRYGKRKQNKREWVEWQKYDAKLHISMMHDNTATLNASVLNSARIQVFSRMVSSLGKDLAILDVGCGDGVIAEPITKMGNKVTCVELPGVSELALKFRVPQVVTGDAEQLSFAPESFDAVIASEVVEHMWNPRQFFAEANRILKSGGHLIVETPEGEEGLNYDSHMHSFTVESLRHMLRERFVVREVERLEATGRAQTPTIIMLLRKSYLVGKEPE
jgi:2-polyprenyl-3-methyl-5-hydroxy-6-metoxy-1,4-benzoquinol methylase